MSERIKEIIKRDGRTVEYDIDKIKVAIYKAAEVLGGKNEDMAEDLAEEVERYLVEELNNDRPTVEEIQDAVEKVLIENGHARTAKEYILYRAERTRIREMNTRLMKKYEDLTFKAAKDNDMKRENANINADTAMGTMLKYGSEGSKQFYQMFVLKPEHAKAHAEGDIHIHDLDFYTLTTTCTQIPLQKLFKGGFSTGHGFLREPNDIQSYAALACIAIQSNQNDQHGGQSVPNFDYAMAVGVRKTYKNRYVQNVARCLELFGISDNALETAKKIAAEIKEDTGLVPVLSGEKTYVAGIVKKGDYADVAYGFSFEKLVLYAWSLGIGTTWIGGTMKREVFEKAAGLKEGYMMPCVSPLGYPAKKKSIKEAMMRKGVGADERMPADKLFFRESFDKPLDISGGDADLFEMVRWAPSAVNKQPWRIVVCGDSYHFYEKKDKGYVSDKTGDLQKIDVGIALCHFVSGLEEQGRAASVTVSDPGIAVPENTEYIATVTV